MATLTTDPEALDIVVSLRNTAVAERRISAGELELVDQLLAILHADH